MRACVFPLIADERHTYYIDEDKFNRDNALFGLSANVFSDAYNIMSWLFTIRSTMNTNSALKTIETKLDALLAGAQAGRSTDAGRKEEEILAQSTAGDRLNRLKKKKLFQSQK